MKRVILIVLDSLGVGELPDAGNFGDKGSHTLDNIWSSVGGLTIPRLKALGLGNIQGINRVGKVNNVIGAYGKAIEKSIGKDTVTGHWEMAGVILEKPLRTYPNGFSDVIIQEFKKKSGVSGILGNKVASGTRILEELGEEHLKTGFPIIYTSADSVFQIAAHEDVISLDALYKMCQVARDMLVGEKVVGRVIARPFVGDYPNFKRTTNRHDYALDPFGKTMLEYIKDTGKAVAGVGKIKDIYNGKGITHSISTNGNMDGVNKTLEYMDNIHEGLIFTNLVDFDMLYGHRNDPKGYGRAIEDFDSRLEEIFSKLKRDDLLILTADHGCDPTTVSTDHSREYIPILAYGTKIKNGTSIGTRNSFADIGKSILDYLDIENELPGESFKDIIL